MSCPFSDEHLAVFDGVTNPMGDECCSCIEFECEHNVNYNENPECIDMMMDSDEFEDESEDES